MHDYSKLRILKWNNNRNQMLSQKMTIHATGNTNLSKYDQLIYIRLYDNVYQITMQTRNKQTRLILLYK